MPVKTSRQTHPNGLSDVVAIARFVVSRWDLGARLQCVVESRAAPGRLSGNALTLDVHGTCRMADALSHRYEALFNAFFCSIIFSLLLNSKI